MRNVTHAPTGLQQNISASPVIPVYLFVNTCSQDQMQENS